MPHAVLNCPLLRELDIASCHKLSDAAIRSAVISCPLLESLDMSNCSCVSDETLQGIAQACVHLRILDASYCPNISLEVSPPSPTPNSRCLCIHYLTCNYPLKSVRLTMLTVLKLHSCEGITSASMVAIASSTLLEVRIPSLLVVFSISYL